MRAAPLLLILLVVAAPAFAGGIAPVDDAFCTDMKAHHVLGEDAPVGCDRLSVVTFDYVDFAGTEHWDGKIVVMDAVAPYVLRIFDALHERHFPIGKARPVNAYDGDDEASMADDNTSGFNDRAVAGSTRPSLHAYGVAIDINPVQNPFITRQGAVLTVHPAAGADHVNRTAHRPGKPDRVGAAEDVVGLFAENGFTEWGGNWDDPLDYQHFDIGRPLAEALAKLPPPEARRRFEEAVSCRSRHCDQGASGNVPVPR
jgi:hypothetical protein